MMDRAPGETWEWEWWVNGLISCQSSWRVCNVLCSCVHMYMSYSSQHRQYFGCLEFLSCSHAKEALANSPSLPWCSWWKVPHHQEMAAQGDGGIRHVTREEFESTLPMSDLAQLHPPAPSAPSCPYVPLQWASPGEAAQFTAPTLSWDLLLTQRGRPVETMSHHPWPRSRDPALEHFSLWSMNS